jgi:hypothetical protein
MTLIGYRIVTGGFQVSELSLRSYVTDTKAEANIAAMLSSIDTGDKVLA